MYMYLCVCVCIYSESVRENEIGVRVHERCVHDYHCSGCFGTYRHFTCMYVNMYLYVVVCYSVLWSGVAQYRRVLQRVAMCRSTWLFVRDNGCSGVCVVTVCYSLLQCVAVLGSCA